MCAGDGFVRHAIGARTWLQTVNRNRAKTGLIILSFQERGWQQVYPAGAGLLRLLF